MTSTQRQNAGTGPTPAPQSHAMFHRSFAAHPSTVRDTLNQLRDRFRGQVSDDTLGRLELVLAEVMNNIARHGGSVDGMFSDPDTVGLAMIHLSIVCHPGGMACAITDDGKTLPQDCLLPRSLPGTTATGLPEGGFGWFLIQDLTQSLVYYREAQRNVLAFNVPLDGD
ncbi:ATP-binding protein [Paracoccus sp. (in: a-proteobacteria)]|uniref:ATP-binding protein n=1 Tax=Paracoccus sp. TaxID=267 RepID=UPI0026E10ED3|nr:ATP-binding protein [Paracoccus sp. (in: a-proteobacteria)]MDO5647455.1 ATP-binding protein [Paracoccus sp. (in: a-proteobacteria)]